MSDRAMQALYLLGLDPIAESRADGHSYGFRLERRCADALEQSHTVLGNRSGPEWILEGDIKACFDRISHDWLLTHVPMDRQLLGQWLKAGFLEKHAWFATTEGTPQGGIISPVLANWTLDGLQRLLAEHFAEKRGRQRKFKVLPGPCTHRPSHHGSWFDLKLVRQPSNRRQPTTVGLATGVKS